MTQRTASVTRKTAETDISITINLDGKGSFSGATGVGFFDHMLSHIAKHGLMDIELTATGDLEVDAHHLVEDVGIVMGQALAEALGEKKGIRRYGVAVVPMDEALALVAIDLSGRPTLRWSVQLPAARVGDFDTELAREFFQAVANSARLTLHIRQIDGWNTHHILEAIFKAFGRALDEATAIDPRRGGDVPSTKQVL